jgi:hypothetical protein
MSLSVMMPTIVPPSRTGRPPTRGVAQAHARRRGDELRRHELADVDARARVACRREQQIPLGDDPDEPALAVDDGQAPQALLLHELERLLVIRVAGNGDDGGGHACADEHRGSPRDDIRTMPGARGACLDDAQGAIATARAGPPQARDARRPP